MFNKLFNLKLKSQMVIMLLLMTLGFVIAGVMGERFYQSVTVGGDVYDEVIANKDLTADILPPPNYLIESWQIALEMAAIKNQPLQPLIDKSNQLTTEFETRVQHWDVNLLKTQMRDKFKNELQPYGEAFIRLRDQEYIPAVQSGDVDAINASLAKLQQAYLKHRKAVDDLVVMAAEDAAKIESEVPAHLDVARTSIIGVVLVALGFSLMGILMVVGNVVRKMGGEASDALAVAEKIALGEFHDESANTNLKPNNVIGALNIASNTLVEIDHEMAKMEAEHIQGNIDAVIDISKFKGAYREMAIGINRMVDSHIAVMNKSTNCIKDLANGQLNEEVEQFPGKFARVNDGIEGLRYNINTLLSDMRHMAAEHAQGNIAVKMDPEKFAGDYRLVAEGINEMVVEYIDEVEVIVTAIGQFGNGDFSAKIKEFPGEKAYINKSIKKIGGNLKGLIDSVNWVSGAHEKGEIDMTLRDDMFKGDFSTLAKA